MNTATPFTTTQNEKFQEMELTVIPLRLSASVIDITADKTIGQSNVA